MLDHPSPNATKTPLSMPEIDPPHTVILARIKFVAQAVQDWIKAVGAKTAYIEPGSPWENGYCESFNARFGDEFLNGEVFYSLSEAEILIEQWRKHYNTKRPHSALGYRPPAPKTIAPMELRPVMH